MRTIRPLSITFTLIFAVTFSFAQNWISSGALNNGALGNTFGTNSAHTVRVFTNNDNILEFTRDEQLGQPGTTLGNASPGDGLFILPKTWTCAGPPFPSTEGLKLWSSCGNGNHIQWGLNGQISGTNSQFEQTAGFGGFWFNTTGGGGYYKFNHASVESGRIGGNKFWRIGLNTTNLNASRRLEIVDFNTPQLRLTHGASGTGVPITITDFQTTSTGHLRINPTNGRIGINLTPGDPTHNIDVNGDARIRNIPTTSSANCVLVGVNQTGGVIDNQVNRLDFPGTSYTTLLGNGTFGSPLGNICGGTTNPIPSVGWQIPIDNSDFQFTVATGNDGSVRIGNLFPVCTTSIAKLYVYTNGVKDIATWNDASSSSSGSIVATKSSSYNAGTGTALGVASSSTTAGNGVATGVEGVAFAGGSGLGIGVHGAGKNTGTGNSIGVFGEGNGTSAAFATSFGVVGSATLPSNLNVGVQGLATNTVGFQAIAGLFQVLWSGASANTGVDGQANLSSNPGAINVAGDFMVSGNAGQGPLGGYTSTNIAVRASCITAVGGTTPDWAGMFDGDVYGSGGYLTPSDRNLKKEIKSIENSLDIINKLNPVNYMFDIDKHPNMGLPIVKQWGFISQEVKEILPELTKQTAVPALFDHNGKEINPKTEVLTLNYQGFIAILTSAIQEQQKQIEELKEMVGMMQQTNDVSNPDVHQQDVELSDKDYVVLNQNVPNPFAEQTTISYIIPANANDAQIIFYNSLGKMIKNVVINDRGEGRLNVYADDLSSGVYSYSLFVDNQLIDTKKMVKK